MARYIDAEIAIEMCNKLIDNAYSCPNPYAIEGVEIVKNLILSDCQTGVPTADVVEVKHGKWIEHFSYGCWHYDCPFCVDGYATKEKDKTPPYYCGNCGARLEGVNRSVED